MTGAKEKQFLRAILRRVDQAPARTAAIPRNLGLLWVVLAVLFTVAFSAAPLLSPIAAGVIFALLGAAGAMAFFLIRSARGWLMLAPYMDRAAIQARLDRDEA